MLVTQDAGEIRARPMRAVAVRGDNAILLIDDGEVRAADTLAAHDAVCLTFVDLAHRSFVSVSGEAQTIDDPATLRDVWRSELKARRSGAADGDPARVVRVTPKFAEIWDDPTADVVAALATLTASDAALEIPRNRRVAMDGCG